MDSEGPVEAPATQLRLRGLITEPESREQGVSGKAASTPAHNYAKEIRAWLLGRLERRRTAGPIPGRRRTRLRHPPTMSWWIFEGHRYRGLDGPLALNWEAVDRQARRLFGTYNPAWRRVGVPEGETDWIESGFQTLTSGRPVYVSQASRVGLSDNEQTALTEWLSWIHRLWRDYTASLGPPEGSTGSLPWAPYPGTVEEPEWGHLRRWAHVAKRSRWPLLRNVVAESLRCMIEVQDLDRLPLPSEHATLFELLCMVRILKALGGTPDHIRWLDLDTGQNSVRIPGLEYRFQHHLKRELVLSTDEFGNGLREAVVHGGLPVPSRIDGWLEFDQRRAGFDGILVEAKSGSQGPDAAIYQLKCYQAALARELGPRRLLIWGIVEEDWRTERIVPLPTNSSGLQDAWLFSTVDEVATVLQRLGLSDASYTQPRSVT